MFTKSWCDGTCGNPIVVEHLCGMQLLLSYACPAHRHSWGRGGFNPGRSSLLGHFGRQLLCWISIMDSFHHVDQMIGTPTGYQI